MWNNIDKLKDDTSLCSYLFFIFVGGGKEEGGESMEIS